MSSHALTPLSEHFSTCVSACSQPTEQAPAAIPPAQTDGMTVGRDGRHALSPDRRSIEVGRLYSLSGALTQ